MSAKIKRF